MNIIWIIVVFLGMLCMVFTSPAEILPAMIAGSNFALKLSFELLAIYAVWLGILGIVENTKLSKGLSKGLSPLINLLWGKNSLNEKAKKYLSLSLATSVLGIGGASVPIGIKAVEEMNDKSGTITYPMIMTIVFASSGVQIIPSTIMSLMIASGSTNASFIILPTLISGICTTLVGVSLAIFCEKLSIRKKHKTMTLFKSESTKPNSI